MDRKIRKELEELDRRDQAAGDASISFYTATVDAPPHPHTVLGIAAGDKRATPMEAVLSMQRRASDIGADGVLGVSIIAVGTHTDMFLAYGTAVQWAHSE
ncbi:heavy metal-binding domain-containing protein [Streptomyces sp. NPDC046324]|uniref:heavy metal-binding domain-containing protein n=1 Tax=Streptomyces sp. NPDC046324 TaxID=3154915 RepID=UPI0033F48BBF